MKKLYLSLIFLALGINISAMEKEKGPKEGRGWRKWETMKGSDLPYGLRKRPDQMPPGLYGQENIDEQKGPKEGRGWRKWETMKDSDLPYGLRKKSAHMPPGLHEEQ